MVSSEMGISRSAVMVAAYLMIFHHMTILEALMTIRKKRAIYPNDGFLKQLRELNEKLLEERQEEAAEDSDEDETGSQSSVIRTGSRSMLSGAEDSGSIMGAKVHSIMVEEEDTTSLLGSVMSASSMGKASLVSKQPTLISEEEEEQLYEEWRKKQGLPAKELPSEDGESKPQHCAFQEQEGSDEDMSWMIQEWQSRNEKYQMESYLFPKEETGGSSMEGKSYIASDMSDTESVSSQEIRILKQQLEASGINRMRRERTDSMSTESTWDMWNERMLEIENKAAQRYSSKMKCEGENIRAESGTKEKDVDEESILSETSSFYNFCQKHKDKLTPLERWKIKRIQFGFHKRDSEASEHSKAEEGSQQNKEAMEEEKSLTDANLTAYQAWKAKHQKKMGNENKNEIVELAKDSASAKRKQRRMELLEHSKKVLEESQSLCSWEAESTMSGSIPLSAFWPSTASVNGQEDSTSALSMQTNRSSFSQARSSTGAVPSVPNLPIGPEDTISIASIQNWIANVVNETIAQKQNEILMLSRPSSVLAASVKSGDPDRYLDDDKTSLLSAQSGLSQSSSLLHQQNTQCVDTQSILSCNTSMSERTGGSNLSRKVTQTSKPLYSLFADEVDLKKLSRKEKEMQMELRGKMSDYQTEKIISNNKRSTLFKKKKIKGDDEDETTENYTKNTTGGIRDPLQSDLDRSDTASALSGQFASVGAVRLQVENNVNEWLKGLKTKEKPSYQDSTDSGGEKYRRSSTFREQDTEASSYKFHRSQRDKIDSSSTYQCNNDLQRTSSRFSSASSQEDKEAYTFTRSKISETSSREESPEPYFFKRTPETAHGSESPEPTTQSRIRSHHLEEHEEESSSDVSEFGAKRKFTQSFAKSEENGEKEEKLEDRKECFASRQSFRHRQRTRKEEEEEAMDDDAIIAAWRNRQEETKAKLRRRREE